MKTAYQIADELEERNAPYEDDAANFIRQQQAEIEALKLQLHTTLTNRDLRTYDGKTEMNNEPVAWMNKRTSKCVVFINTPPSDDWIPLYTHPVKELTDKEIYACFHQYFVLGEPKPTHYELEYEDLIDFARAILRKAQEK